MKKTVSNFALSEKKNDGAPSKNELKDMQNKHKKWNNKHKHSLSYFANRNAGNVEYNNAMFNHMNGNPEVPDAFIDSSSGDVSVSSDGGFGGDSCGACEKLTLKDAFTKLEDVEDEYDYGCDICGNLTPAVYPDLHWMYGGSFGICDRCFNRMTDHDIARLDMTGDPQIIDKYASELATAQVVNESALNEGTSNFWSMDKFPLLVFEDYETVYDKLYDKAKEELNLDDFDGDILDSPEFEKKFEELWDEQEVCALDESEQDELKLKISEFNDKMNYDERHDPYEESDVDIVIKSGYYEGAQIYVKDEDYLSDWQVEEINKFLSGLKEEFHLTTLGVAWHASNGETGYSILKESLLLEASDKRDSVKNRMKIGRKFTGIVYYINNDIVKDGVVSIPNLNSNNANQYISLGKNHMKEYSKLTSFRIFVNGEEVIDSLQVQDNGQSLDIQKFEDNKLVSNFDPKSIIGDKTSISEIAKPLYDDAKSNSDHNVKYVVFVDDKEVFNTSNLKASKIGKAILAQEEDSDNNDDVNGTADNPTLNYKLVLWGMDGENPETASQRILKVLVVDPDKAQLAIKQFSKFIKQNTKIQSIISNGNSDAICAELYANDGTTTAIKAFVDDTLFRHINKQTLTTKSDVPQFDFTTDGIKGASSKKSRTPTPASNASRTANASQTSQLNGKIRKLLGMDATSLPKDKIKELVTLINGATEK